LSPARWVVALVVVAGTLASGPAPARTPAGAAKPIVTCEGCWPTAFSFTPDGKHLFYLERYSGEIHRVDMKSRANRVWGSVGPVNAEGERGALGIALDPAWKAGRRSKRTRWVYVFYSHEDPFENRVVRVRKRLNRRGLTSRHLASIPFDPDAIPEHAGGPLAFGPDGNLYILTGDQTEQARAQDVTDLAGKTLRLQPDGGIPPDNPYGAVYSYGHRNAFGLAFDPLTGRLWETENGPQCDDELNIIQAGENYGWGGASECPDTSSQGPSPTQPAHQWTPPIAPTGMAFEATGDLLVGAYATSQILRLTLDAERDAIVTEAAIYTHERGVLALVLHPDGRVYFSESEGIYLLKP